MKSLYFTSKHIDAQAEELLSQVVQKNHRTAGWQQPALLVLDMQQYFLREESHAFVPSAPAIVPGILELIERFELAGLPVFFTQHLNTGENAGNMATWWRELITTDLPDAGLIEPLHPYQKEAIQKTQYDAFYETDLRQQLDSRQVTDVIVTGVMTHLCCETTARSAFVRGYRVWFPVDGTATYHADLHLGTLRSLAHGFARIPTMRQLLGRLNDD